MSDNPFFSVILNTYNSQKTIKRTLESILNQTFTDFELIIIDDNSSDKTINTITKILGVSRLKKQYRLISLSKNSGISFSRNLGIDKAHGQYICFIDGDDLWQEKKLEIQYKFLAANDFLIDWLFSNYYVIDDQYNVISVRKRKKGIYNYKSVIHNGNPAGMLTVAVKTKILKQNRFRKIRHEDYDLWIRLSKKGIIGFLIDENLAMYMKHNQSLSSNKYRSILWTYNVFRENNISPLYSIYLLCRYIANYFLRKSFVNEK